MRRWSDMSWTVGLCTSLVMHGLLALVLLWLYVLDMEAMWYLPSGQRIDADRPRLDLACTPPSEEPPTPPDELPKEKPKPEEASASRTEEPKPETPPKPDNPAPPDQFGDSQGRGNALHSATGKEPMQGRQGPQNQAWLSRDPVGPGALPKEPSFSTALPGMNGDGRPRSGGTGRRSGAGTGAATRIQAPSPAAAAARNPVGGGAASPPAMPRIAIRPPSPPPPSPPPTPVATMVPAPPPRPQEPQQDRVMALGRPTTHPADHATAPATRPVNHVVARVEPPTQPAAAGMPSTRPSDGILARSLPTIAPTPTPEGVPTSRPSSDALAKAQPTTRTIANAPPTTRPADGAIVSHVPTTGPALETPDAKEPAEGILLTKLPARMVPGTADTATLPSAKPAEVSVLRPGSTAAPNRPSAATAPSGGMAIAASGGMSGDNRPLGGTGPAGPPVPPADPAPMSDLESDAFSTLGSVVVRAGKVDVQLGRKVKPITPRLPLKGQLDLRSLSDPRVILKVTIDESGNVKDVSIIRSSGSNEVDLPTRLALYKWWIEPAKDRSGNPRKDVILLSLSFH